MKRLTLLRHAKSDWGDRGARDFDRGLNDRGMRAAFAIGRHLRATGAAFDHVIASDAVRVVETLSGVERGLARWLGVEWDRRLYLASVQVLLDMVHGLPPAASHALIAGHNPGLEDLALMLVPEIPGDHHRAALAEKLPTGSLVMLAFDVDDWGAITAGGQINDFVRPRDLDPSLGPDGED